MITHQQSDASFKIVEQNSIIYSINDKEKTAIVIGNNSAFGYILIPNIIYHESKEYSVIKIAKHAFKNAHEIKHI